MSLIDVNLEIFEGPLDLLLYLVKKNNLDIYDIPISQITQQYLEYLEVMKELDLDIAGDFLIMAATLMQIKIKMLIFKSENNDEEDDPRVELAEMLKEYEKYKMVTSFLSERYNKFKDVFYRGSPIFSNEDKHLEVDIRLLIDAVKRAFERVGNKTEIEIEDVPIESRIEKILSLLSNKNYLVLDELFKDEKTKRAIVTVFLALLELVKINKIRVIQEEQFGEVKIYLV
ncbi:MAG: segregation/condensation protein A [Elusimicrobiales bacterium]|nr:segregation/condensation protein A [Elusimicrobiales bacterium]